MTLNGQRYQKSILLTFIELAAFSEIKFLDFKS